MQASRRQQLVRAWSSRAQAAADAPPPPPAAPSQCAARCRTPSTHSDASALTSAPGRKRVSATPHGHRHPSQLPCHCAYAHPLSALHRGADHVLLAAQVLRPLNLGKFLALPLLLLLPALLLLLLLRRRTAAAALLLLLLLLRRRRTSALATLALWRPLAAATAAALLLPGRTRPAGVVGRCRGARAPVAVVHLLGHALQRLALHIALAVLRDHDLKLELLQINGALGVLLWEEDGG
jgi:hypothetical protein